MKISGRYHALLKTSCLREATIERRHIKRRIGEKSDAFQDQYDHRITVRNNTAVLPAVSLRENTVALRGVFPP